MRVLHKRKNLLVDYDSASTAELRVVTVQIGTLADLDVAHAEVGVAFGYRSCNLRVWLLLYSLTFFLFP